MFMSLLHLLNAGFAGFPLLLLLAPIGFAGFVLLRIVRCRAKPFAAMALVLFLVPPIPAQAAIDNSQKANSCIRVTQESQGINYENICGRNINVTHCWDTHSVQGGGQCVFERSSAGVVGGSNFFIGASFVVVAACRPPFGLSTFALSTMNLGRSAITAATRRKQAVKEGAAGAGEVPILALSSARRRCLASGFMS